jgi:mono/diheme cytochrome c family protein
LDLDAGRGLVTLKAVTRTQFIAALVGAAVVAAIGIRMARHGFRHSRAVTGPAPRPLEQKNVDGVTTNPTPTNSPAGVYLGKNNLVFVNYGTRDPALQSFMRAVMDGSYDTTAKGRAIFLKICAACHQPDGMGKAGVAPPLTGSEWVLAANGDRLARIVLNGLSGPVQVKGHEWNLVMPPLRENLKDDQIAVVLTYVRSNVGGNKAGPITLESVAAARKESHPAPETVAELLKPSE